MKEKYEISRSMETALCSFLMAKNTQGNFKKEILKGEEGFMILKAKLSPKANGQEEF